MLNINQIIREDYGENEEPKNNFLFKGLAKAIIRRQQNEKDTIIAVIGERGNGKSNWSLKLIKSFIKLKKEEDKNYSWSWKDNFPLTPSQAPKQIEKIPDYSFAVVDEAADFAFKGDANTLRMKNLIKFFNKSRKKCLLTLWVLPDVYQLSLKILNMCNMVVIVPYRYRQICSAAFILMRSPNALSRDKFGLEKLNRYLESRRSNPLIHSSTLTHTVKIRHKNEFIDVPYPFHLFNYYKSLTGFVHMHWFKRVDKVFEKAYIKNVKEKQLLAHETEERYVRKDYYEKIKKAYETVLFRLHEKQGLSYQQIANLHMDERGEYLVSKEIIARKIIKMRAHEEISMGE